MSCEEDNFNLNRRVRFSQVVDIYIPDFSYEEEASDVIERA
jgi:uncharacterized Fe-S radical SAM superfamily protein PflX